MQPAGLISTLGLSTSKSSPGAYPKQIFLSKRKGRGGDAYNRLTSSSINFHVLTWTVFMVQKLSKQYHSRSKTRPMIPSCSCNYNQNSSYWFSHLLTLRDLPVQMCPEPWTKLSLGQQQHLEGPCSFTLTDYFSLISKRKQNYTVSQKIILIKFIKQCPSSGIFIKTEVLFHPAGRDGKW
jgi:hypothetical protein